MGRHTPEAVTAQSSVKRENEKNKKKYGTLSRGVKVIAGLSLAGGIMYGATTDKAHEVYDDLSYAPNPPVSSMGTEALIAGTNTLLDYGPPVLFTGMAAGGAYWLARRRNPDGMMAEMHDTTHQVSRRNRIIFTGAVLGLVGGAVGLGNAASEGANEPVKAMAEMMGANMDSTPVVKGYDVLPLNTTAIDPKVNQIITESGGVPVDFIAALGAVNKPGAKEADAASAPILAVPNEVLKQSLGVSMPEVADCKDMTVVVGDQLGVQPGGKAIVNDRPATVVKTVSQRPGLNRIGVVTSLEQAEECLFDNKMPMSGAIALGLDGKQDELQQKVRAEINPIYSVGSFKTYEDRYKDFWDRSVKPPQMILILSGLALGSAAIAGMQTSEILMRRKNIGMQLSQGVEKKTIKRSYNIATQKDTLFAAAASLPFVIGLDEIYNSSQNGVAEALNIPSVAAAYTAMAATTALTSIITRRVIDRIDPAVEIRGGV